MVLSLKNCLKENYNIDGDIILYRDDENHTQKMCEYVSRKLDLSDKAALYLDRHTEAAELLARMYPNKTIYLYNANKALSQLWPNIILESGKISTEHQVEFLQLLQCMTQYYTTLWPIVLGEVQQYCSQIDGYCNATYDYLTLRGFLDSTIAPQHVILGIRNIYDTLDEEVSRTLNYPLLKDKAHQFDWVNIVEEFTATNIQSLSALLKDFGTIKESFKSIAAAIEWLKVHSNQNILIFIGQED